MKMNRATIVYGAMILGCALGEWAVLSFGERIVAPEDLAGKWTLVSRLPAGAKGAAFGPGITIDQSGRFFQMAIDNGPKLNMELEQQTYLGAPGQAVTMELVNGPWRMVVEGMPRSDDMYI